MDVSSVRVLVGFVSVCCVCSVSQLVLVEAGLTFPVLLHFSNWQPLLGDITWPINFHSCWYGRWMYWYHSFLQCSASIVTAKGLIRSWKLDTINCRRALCVFNPWIFVVEMSSSLVCLDLAEVKRQSRRIAGGGAEFQWGRHACLLLQKQIAAA